MQNKVKGVM